MQQIIADLVVQNPAEKDAKLMSALETAIQAANVDKACGLLLTRHHYAKFTVALPPKVPYGRGMNLTSLPSRVEAELTADLAQ
jgi:hypothetical protein